MLHASDFCAKILLPSLVGFLMLPEVAHALTPEDCLGGGGTLLCSAPTTSEWTHRLCDEAPASMPVAATWCGVRGGEWRGPYNGGCVGGSPDAESNLVSRAQAFLSASNGGDECPINDSGWGQSIDAYHCWDGSPTYSGNILTADFRSLRGSSCGPRIYARRNREVVCPPESSLSSIDGQPVCVTERQFTGCSVGNPIRPLTGNKVQNEQDFSAPGIQLARIYGSFSTFVPYNVQGDPTSLVGQFGHHWRTSFDYRLFILNGSTSAFAISFPNGAVQYFDASLNPVGGSYKAGSLSKISTQYRYEYDGKQLTFAADGRLVSIRNSNGMHHYLKYAELDFNEPIAAVLPNGELSTTFVGSGRLVSVENASGGKLVRFHYDAADRVVIVEAGGDQVFYEYDRYDNLITVARQGGDKRSYSYADSNCPTHLTGIVDENDETYASWTYDSQCRAVFSRHADGADATHINYDYINDSSSPRVTVTNSLNKKATYHFSIINGARKVTQVEGHASESCAASDNYLTYYSNGLLETKTDKNGTVVRYHYNSRGLEIKRIEAEGTAEERIIYTEWHPTLNLRTKVTEPGKVVGHTYDDQGRRLSTTVESL